MTVLIVLAVVVIAQTGTVEIVRTSRARRYERPRQPVAKELTEEEKTVRRIVSSRKEFLPDGTLHLVMERAGPRLRQYGSKRTAAVEKVYDVNDRLLWEGPVLERPYTYLSWAEEVRRDSLTAAHMKTIRTIMPDAWSMLQIPVGIEEQAEETWRYCPDGETFVGYGLSGQRLGHLGATGWSESKSEARPFGPFKSFLAWRPQASSSLVLLWQTRRRIYQIDVEARQVDLVYENPQSDIERVWLHRWDSFRIADTEDERPGTYRDLLHCQGLDGRHHVVLRDPARTVTIALPKEWEQWMGNHCTFTATTQGLFMRRNWIEYPMPPASSKIESQQDWWDEYRRHDKTWWIELHRVSEAGDLALVNRFSYLFPSKTETAVRYDDPRSGIRRWVNAFSAPLYDFLWIPFPTRFWAALYERSDFTRGLLRAIGEVRPGYSLWNGLVTLVFVALTFLHGRPRRTSWPTLVFWLVFVALLNLAGFLTYWALNHTPVIRCSTCGKRRGLSRVECVHCQAPLPTPKHGKLDLIPGLGL